MNHEVYYGNMKRGICETISSYSLLCFDSVKRSMRFHTVGSEDRAQFITALWV